MSGISHALASSIGRKLIMAVTGLFLVTFLIVHVALNSLIFINDGGLLFNEYSHFMGHNAIIRTLEIVLFLGFIVHIYQSYVLSRRNEKSRPVKYAVSNANSNSTWYSRSMGLLGTIILIFLIVHLANFWVKSRFTGLGGMDSNHNENLYGVMYTAFKNPWVVILYVAAEFSLAWHLIHGFSSAFQTLGFNHHKYTPSIKWIGYVFAIAVSTLFAAMPIVIYFGLIKEI